MEDLIRIKDLTKRYEGFTLDGVSLDVAPSEVVGLVGRNGAGKTTLIKSLLGLIPYDGGAAELLGERASVTNPRLAAVKRHVGTVFDTIAFPQTLRVRDVATLGSLSYGDMWDYQLFDGLVHDVALDGKKVVRDLSRGMGMRLQLAFALAHRPDLLVLDEATAGLDPLAREDVLDVLRGFMAEREGHGILLATHITTDLEHIADRIVCLDEGRITFALTRDAICDEAGIAHLRSEEAEHLLEPGMRYLRHEYSCDLLVPDRRAFAREHPDIAVDAADIESYMTITLKGDLA